MGLKSRVQARVTREVTDWKLAGREQVRVDALRAGASPAEASREAIKVVPARRS
jgi:hypothetical protein